MSNATEKWRGCEFNFTKHNQCHHTCYVLQSHQKTIINKSCLYLPLQVEQLHLFTFISTHIQYLNYWYSTTHVYKCYWIWQMCLRSDVLWTNPGAKKSWGWAQQHSVERDHTQLTDTPRRNVSIISSLWCSNPQAHCNQVITPDTFPHLLP